SSKKARFINFGWFSCILIVLTIVTGGISYLNTKRLVERAEVNNKETRELLGILQESNLSQYIVATDQMGRQYIDSINNEKTRKAQRAEDIIINQATAKLTEYTDNL